MISYDKCKKVLTAIWLVGALIPFSILALQTIYGTFWGGKESEAWALFTPMVMPTVGLIIGALVADALNPPVEDKKVNGTLFWVTVALSLLYLGMVTGIFLSLPGMAGLDVTAEAGGKDAAKSASGLMDAFKRSGLILGAIQGFVTATMGVFFVNRNQKPGAGGGAGEGAKGDAKKTGDAVKGQADAADKKGEGAEGENK